MIVMLMLNDRDANVHVDELDADVGIDDRDVRLHVLMSTSVPCHRWSSCGNGL